MIVEQIMETLPNGLKRFVQVGNIIVDASKQEIALKIDYVLKTPDLNEVVEVEKTELIFRKNIDETGREGALWVSLIELANTYTTNILNGVIL